MSSTPYGYLYDDVEEGLGTAATLLPPETPWTPRVLLSFPSEFFTSRLLCHWCRDRLQTFSPSPKAFRQCATWQLIVTVVLIILGTLRLMPPDVPRSDACGIKRLPSTYFIWPPPAWCSPESLRYVVFQPKPDVDRPTHALDQPHYIPQSVLEYLFDPRGTAADSQLENYFSYPRFDVVWTWVNGSDPLHHSAMKVAESRTLAEQRGRFGRNLEPLASVEEFDLAFQRRKSSLVQLYRDHDELRYSIRSVLRHFASYTHRLHILSADFALPLVLNASIVDLDVLSPNQVNNSSRVGQIPQWLTDRDWPNNETWEHEGIKLGIHHHAQFFESYQETNFNSFAIESQLGRVPGILEHFIYMNDDYFMTADLSPADFYTPKFGIVLRMQSDLLVASSNPSSDDPNGEWRPLQYSNWLLDRRYGSRKRPYLAHAPKSISLSIFQELTALTNGTAPHSEAPVVLKSFHDALLRTSEHIYRGQFSGQADHDDAYAMFLFGHHIVERWREILLWSWVVGRLGGLKGEWRSNVERMTAWSELGGISPGHISLDVNVMPSIRDTLDEEVVNKALGRKTTGPTSYVFSSVDGYPYAFTRSGAISSWPQFTRKSAGSRMRPSTKIFECTIQLERCFPEAIDTASRAFTNIAFEHPECGDCVIRSLISSSGLIGLKAFLPDGTRALRSSHPPSSHSQLPLGTHWAEINYSLKDVITPWVDSGTVDSIVNIREWTLRAMSRYHFVLGDTPFEFLKLNGVIASRNKLSRLSRSIAMHQLAMICINDDLLHNVEEVDNTFRGWMEKMWPTKLTWESP